MRSGKTTTSRGQILSNLASWHSDIVITSELKTSETKVRGYKSHRSPSSVKVLPMSPLKVLPMSPPAALPSPLRHRRRGRRRTISVDRLPIFDHAEPTRLRFFQFENNLAFRGVSRI